MSLLNELWGKENFFPRYNKRGNFNTNAESYYKYLERVNEVLKIMAKKIDEYDGTVQEYLLQWDKNLEDFPDDVKDLLEEWVIDGTLEHIINHEIFQDKLDTSIFEQFELSVNQQLTKTDERLTQLSYQLPVGTQKGTDITLVLQNLIDAIKTTDHTEDVPENTVMGEIKLPGGKFYLSKTIKIPSNIKLVGNGKNNTVLLSNINDGSPMVHVYGGPENGNRQFFHNEFSGFTLDGQNNNCVGIRLDNTSRWKIENVMVTETDNTGIYLWESYLGEMISVLVRECGDANHSSVVHDGHSLNYGTHAITYVGGEIVGAAAEKKTIKAGLEIKQAMSVSAFGTTFEGFFNGYGIIDDNSIGTVINGCYFEHNKGHILAKNPLNPNYISNFMTATEPDSLGFIVLETLNGGMIQGNSFIGNETFPHIGVLNETSKMVYSTVENNVVSLFPLNVSEQLFNLPSSGNIVRTFNGSFDTTTYGNQRFNNRLIIEDKLMFDTPTHFIHYDDGTDSLEFDTTNMFHFTKELLVPSIRLKTSPATAVKLNSIFIDSSDSRLKYKDSFGEVKTITLT